MLLLSYSYFFLLLSYSCFFYLFYWLNASARPSITLWNRRINNELLCLSLMRLLLVSSFPFQSLSQEDPLEKEMAIHSSILAWRIPWTEKPSRLQSKGLQRVGHNWATSPHLTFVGLMTAMHCVHSLFFLLILNTKYNCFVFKFTCKENLYG